MELHRRKIKKIHERESIAAFLRHYNLVQKSNYKVVEAPDPPDAIISNSSSKKWLEHCDAYRSPDEAQEDYESGHHHSGPIPSPDCEIINAIVGTIRSKLSLQSYSKIYSELGPGILVVVCRDPLFSYPVLEELVDVLKEGKDHFNDSRYFDAIYMTWNCSERFIRLLPEDKDALAVLKKEAEGFSQQRDECFDKLS